MLIRRHQKVYDNTRWDEPAVDDNNNVIDFHANNNNSTLFKFKQQVLRQARIGGTKNVEEWFH